MYIISQVLGLYSQQYNRKINRKINRNELPLLHNLIYLNKDSYTGNIERYNREECKLPISKREFMKYFDKNSNFNIQLLFLLLIH
jgi:hypothetical protein